jgi:thiamine pyrophosphokinase
MKNCMIVSGAPVAGQLPITKDEYVIACDAGVGHAVKAGIKPDLLVGDFDTYKEALPEGIPVLTAPSEKDDTDTMMAVRYALEQGFERIRICAALGGRLDHSIGNLSAAA